MLKSCKLGSRVRFLGVAQWSLGVTEAYMVYIHEAVAQLHQGLLDAALRFELRLQPSKGRMLTVTLYGNMHSVRVMIPRFRLERAAS